MVEENESGAGEWTAQGKVKIAFGKDSFDGYSRYRVWGAKRLIYLRSAKVTGKTVMNWGGNTEYSSLTRGYSVFFVTSEKSKKSKNKKFIKRGKLL